MPEGGEEMLTVGELADGVFEGGKVVTGRLRGWLCTGLGRHTAPLSLGKKRALNAFAIRAVLYGTGFYGTAETPWRQALRERQGHPALPDPFEELAELHGRREAWGRIELLDVARERIFERPEILPLGHGGLSAVHHRVKEPYRHDLL